MKTLDRLIGYIKDNQHNKRNINKQYLLKMLYEIDRENQLLENKVKENELLHSVMLSLLKVAKCPHDNCDNNGTIAVQTYPNGEWEPEQCQWCYEKKKVIESEA